MLFKFFISILNLLNSAVTFRRDKAISFNRIAIIVLFFTSVLGYETLSLLPLESGIGIYGGLYQVSSLTQTFVVLNTKLLLAKVLFYINKTRVRLNSKSSNTNNINIRWNTLNISYFRVPLSSLMQIAKTNEWLSITNILVFIIFNP